MASRRAGECRSAELFERSLTTTCGLKSRTGGTPRAIGGRWPAPPRRRTHPAANRALSLTRRNLRHARRDSLNSRLSPSESAHPLAEPKGGPLSALGGVHRRFAF